VVLGGLAVFAPIFTLSACAPHAEEAGQGLSPRAQQELSQVEAEIDRIEAKTLARLGAPPDNATQQVELLGKAMMYDKQLSVNRNEACSLCHMPEAGFAGPVSELNATTRRLSRVGAHALQQSETAVARLRRPVAGAPLQQPRRRPRRRRQKAGARSRPLFAKGALRQNRHRAFRITM
jgi:cytochrome c peroxidase